MEPANQEPLSTLIGRAIRSRRHALGLTLTELAATSHLSQPFLSKVERGIGQLSIPAVDRVAKALGTSAVGLLATMSGEASVDIVRRSERTTFIPFEHAEGLGHIVTRRSGQLGVFEIEGGPAQFSAEPFIHRNDSVCVIVSGTYEFEIDGTVVLLEEGDSVSASGGVGQRYRVIDGHGRMLLIFVSEDVEVAVRPTRTWKP